MKKNAILVIMSFVLAIGSLNYVPVLAAETTEEDLNSAESFEGVVSEEDVSWEDHAEQADMEEEPAANIVPNEPEEQTVGETYEAGHDTSDSRDIAVDQPDDFGSDSLAPEDNERDADAEETVEPESVSKESQNSDAGSFRKEGMCGDNVKWILTGTNPDTDPDLTLTISGEGDMCDFTSSPNWTLYNEDIRKVVIEDGVTSIGDYAFSDFPFLETVTIPDTVTRIGEYAFDGCSILVTVDIPKSVKSIGGYAFGGCSSFTSVIIPDSVTKIGEYAFYGCANMESVSISKSITSLENGVFGDCFNLTYATIPDNVTSIGNDTFFRCWCLARVEIPNKVTSIGDGAFFDCRELTDLPIPNSVTSIGSNAFRDCSKLTSMEIPASVTSIGDGLFCDCVSLESVTIPNSVTNISAVMFSNCVCLGSIEIPTSVTTICEGAFYNCDGLTSVTMPDGVTCIEERAFYGCSNLVTVSIPDSVTSIGYQAFYECDSLKNVTIPRNVTAIEYEAFYGCESLESMIIPQGVTSIGRLAFVDCTNLTSVTIPASVTDIGDDAFYQDEKLTIYGYTGSYAEVYAIENGIPFVSINGMSWTDNTGIPHYYTIALQATSTGCYITCDVGAKNGVGRYTKMDAPDLNADANKIGSYEEFELVPCSDGSYALRAVINRKFLTAYTGSNGIILYGFNADFVGDNAKFILTKGSKGIIKTKNNNLWLCVKKGKLSITTNQDEAEVFNQILVDDNTYTDDELAVLSEDEWFNLNDQGKGFYDIQCAVGNKAADNAKILKDRGYKIMNLDGQFSHDYIEIDRMQCFVAYKKTNGKYEVIIDFQGTSGYGQDDDWQDMWSNLTGSTYTDISGMHEGYHKMADKLYEKESSIIDDKNRINLYSLIEKAADNKAHITLLGHSMGGAIAQCYALHLVNDWKIPKGQITGRTFNSALACDYDDEAFTDWYNICVSTDSVCNGLVPGSIIYYGVHRIGKTIWLYDIHPEDIVFNDGFCRAANIANNKHEMNATLNTLLRDIWDMYRCEHKWDEGVVKTFTYDDQVELERFYTCQKCGRNKSKKATQLSNDIIVSGLNAKPYTGKAITPALVVKLGDKTLKADEDYTVTYDNNTKIGTANVLITGKGAYFGTVKRTFDIITGKTTRGDMFNLANNVKVTWKEVPGAKYYKVYREGITDKKETRKEPVIVTSGLVGWDKDPGLTNGHAYRYKIVASLTGKEDPSGDSTLSYSKLMYRLKTVVIRSVKNTAPGKVTVKYDKTTSGDSYVLQYSTSKDMTGAKTKVVLGANNTSYVIGGLKKGKTYYISIRVRKKVNGIDYYTTFGVPKKVTVTK